MQSGIFLIISTNLLGTRTTVLASLAHCSTSSRTRAAKSATSTMFGCSAIMVCDLDDDDFVDDDDDIDDEYDGKDSDDDDDGDNDFGSRN